MDNDKQRGTQSSRAEALTPEIDEREGASSEMAETDESSFVSELVRQAISQRTGDSMYPLGWLDQQRLDKVLAKYGVHGLARRK